MIRNSSQARRLIEDLVKVGENPLFARPVCPWCSRLILSSRASRGSHAPRCAYRRALAYLEETNEMKESA